MPGVSSRQGKAGLQTQCLRQRFLDNGRVPDDYLDRPAVGRLKLVVRVDPQLSVNRPGKPLSAVVLVGDLGSMLISGADNGAPGKPAARQHDELRRPVVG